MKSKLSEANRKVLLEMDINDSGYGFSSSIDEALAHANVEISVLNETIDSLKALRPECDKLDFCLAASSGAICGVIDIFLVGKPGESALGNLTDKWVKNRTVDFAKLMGWKGECDHSAIGFLERKFKIPYDQRGAGDAASFIFDLNPTNHHFKSLGHNPSLLGLFFSILDQFTDTSHFVSGGQLISLQKADKNYELRGGNVSAKLFCGFANWFGHLISDISGSSLSKGRGMGIPSPLWTWSNDIVTIREKLTEKNIINRSDFGNTFNELALNLYTKGYDVRFQGTQMIPVIINEMIVRLFYAVRRMVKYITATSREERSFSSLWKSCEPFSNATVKRMLTVAHGTFCLIDAGDATIRGLSAGAGTFNPVEYFLRLNIVGIGRFTISLYGEAKRGVSINIAARDARIAEKEKVIVEDYIDGLNKLYELYDDRELISFVDDLKNSDAINALEKTLKLAKLRGVPEYKWMTKEKGDKYFSGRK